MSMSSAAMLVVLAALALGPSSHCASAAVAATAAEEECVAANGSKCHNTTPPSSPSSSSSSSQEQQGTCSLYLAPSSIPGAGLGVYTSVDVPLGSAVGESGLSDELFIPILDKYKTLPYRGQQRFLSWLGYVWPTHPDAFWLNTRKSFPTIHESHYDVNPGLNAATGLTFHDGTGRHNVSAFVPGLASQVNSHLKLANIAKYPMSERRDWAGLEVQLGDGDGKNPGMGAFTPHHGVNFLATSDIPAGSELFLNYGTEWHTRYNKKYGKGYVPFDTLEDYKAKNKIPKTLPTEENKRKREEKMLKKLEQQARERRGRGGDDVGGDGKADKKEREQGKDAKRGGQNAKRGGEGTASTASTTTKTRSSTTSTATTVTETVSTTTNATHVETTTIRTETKTTTTKSVMAIGDDAEEERIVGGATGPSQPRSEEEEPHQQQGEKQAFSTGTPVYKKFKDAGRWFDGYISGYDLEKKRYEVTYSDGDVVYYDDADEVRKMATTNMERKQRKLEKKEEEKRRRKLEKEQKKKREEEERKRELLLEEGSKQYEVGREGMAPIEPVKRIEWLEENGLCIDNIRAGQSTIAQAGRGAFAKTFFSEGSLVAPAPLVALKREDLVIYDADETQNTFRNVLNFDRVMGHELLLNYCYGRADSSLLLLPYAPIVNFINHDGEAPNVKIRWPETSSFLRNSKDWLDLHPLDVLNQSGELMMEFVALRDIAPGEELFLDYGPDWEHAWEKHVEGSKSRTEDNGVAEFRHEIGVPDGFFPDKWNQAPVFELTPLESPLKPGELNQLTWAHNGKPVAASAFRVGLPTGYSARMREFADSRGITDLYEKLIYEPHLHEPHLKSNDWYVFDTHGEQWFAHQYQGTAWKFDMHYVAAWDEAARVNLLRAMGAAGFDVALESIGTSFGLDNLTCFHASFMGVSECDNSFTHADVYASGGKGFNFIWPIITVNGTTPELDIISDDANTVLAVNYEHDVAYVLGDWGYHKTSAIDYGETGQLRIVTGAYCAQIDESNEKMIAHLYDGEEPAPFMDQFKLKEVHWGNGHSLPK